MLNFESISGLFWHFVCCNVAQMSHLFHTNHPLITHSNLYFGPTKPLWSIVIDCCLGVGVIGVYLRFLSLRGTIIFNFLCKGTKKNLTSPNFGDRKSMKLNKNNKKDQVKGGQVGNGDQVGTKRGPSGDQAEVKMTK